MQSVASNSRISGKPALGAKGKRKAGTDVIDDLNGQIATAAYYRAESRGFVSGQELDDWLQAEAEFTGKGV